MKQLYAVTDFVPNISQDYLTPNKEYPVLNNDVDWANERYDYSSFEILDDDGDTIYCLVESCSHLGGKKWTIIEKEVE